MNVDAENSRFEQEPKPWQGEPQVLHQPDEDVMFLSDAVHAELLHAGYTDGGIVASELAERVAGRIYDDEGVRFTTGDVELQISRMMGTKIRMAPNNTLFLDRDNQASADVESIGSGYINEVFRNRRDRVAEASRFLLEIARENPHARVFAADVISRLAEETGFANAILWNELSALSEQKTFMDEDGSAISIGRRDGVQYIEVTRPDEPVRRLSDFMDSE